MERARIFGAIAVALFAAATVSADTLKTAEKLASGKYKGWKYGPEASKKQVDCVQFVQAVVEEELKSTVDKKIRDAILIRYKFKDLGAAVAKGDKRTRGVQYALVDLLKRGTAVPPKDAKKGDLIQYWMKKKDGTWFGHSAVISSVHKNPKDPSKVSVILYGAHKSLGKIGDTTKKLRLYGADRKIYVVRIKP